MTPIEQVEFIRLWNEGATYRQIAAALQCSISSVAAWAIPLIVEGQIEARSPQQQALARQAGTPAAVQRPVQPTDTGAVQRVDTGAVHSLDTGPVQRLDRLEDEVQGLRTLVQSVLDRLDHPPVQTPVQITTLPPYPKGKAVRWNLWILDAIRDELAAMAAEQGVSPSQLVQELLWKELRRT